MENIKQYYKELGKIVYAVAAADGEIKPEEVETLHEFVQKELVKYEPTIDSSGMNQAFYVDFEFENSADQHLKIDEAVRSYARFIHRNFEKGDESLMRHSMALLENVANAYSRKKEQEIVSQIRHEISDISKTILNHVK